ncbi:M20/M25/M40 family metallo-hydrolase [Congregibacter litoralis]|uniref:Carboxypeptidase Q n=1 Tax=Congregibacter litoralis KT71 TaxID=314285 RepID=A4ABZ4_9GAMM|nr:M20/M25/M40 family metallo-hydrolase [Congregibacter litoralis]EAQ96444.2 putative aminopeptidase [Congregibacter litoralis KT71]
MNRVTVHSFKAALCLMLSGMALTPTAWGQDQELMLSEGSIEHAKMLRDTAMQGSMAYEIVESLTTEVGPRLAGTAAEARARDWAVAKLESLGFDGVRVEPFTIEGWERGAESAELIDPYPQPLSFTTLGGSVATPDSGIEADVAFFATLADLEAAAPGSLEGKIAFVSHAMQKTQDGSSYGFHGRLRRSGASIAASKGAVAILIRSIGTDSHRMPHTGSMRYDPEIGKIPAAALSNPDADQLERIHARGETMRVRLNVQPIFTGESETGNVIVDIRGTEHPDEVVIIGGHLDSWDLGTGAIDDGAGIGIATAAAKLILDSGKRPKRSIRLIFWGAEEVGLLGGFAYLERHKKDLDKQIIGTESDFGAGKIWQLNSRVSAEAQPLVDKMAELLAPIGVAPGSSDSPGAGPDLTPLVRAGMPSLRLNQDGRDYFDLHHTPDDTLDKINPHDLDQNVAAFAVFAWLAADTGLSFK